jgi:hypothetical protein
LQNKPNSPIVQLNLSPFAKRIYEIPASLAKVKNKPNSNPISTAVSVQGQQKVQILFDLAVGVR